MEGLYFALSVIAVAIVIRWCALADRMPEGEYRGLLAMHLPQPPAKPPVRAARSSRLRDINK